MQAVILGAGLGERLRPLTSMMAKPSIPVLGKPLVWYIMKNLIQAGVSNIIMTLSYKPNSILSLRLEDEFRHVPIQFIVEPQVLGTGGGMKNVSQYLSEDLLLICNSDSLWDFDLKDAIRNHRSSSCRLSLVLATTPNWQDYTAIRTDQSGQIVRLGPILEIPHASDYLSRPYTFTGIYILQTDLLSQLPRKTIFDFVKDFVVPLMVSGERVNGIVVDGFWTDMGTPKRYLYGCLDYAQRLEKSSVNNIVDESSIISEDVMLHKSVLWKNVSIRGDVALQECIVTHDVELHSPIRMNNMMIISKNNITSGMKGYKSMAVGNAITFSF